MYLFIVSNLDAENPVELFLPNQWVWEMINEYVHQFEQFCVFRSEVDQRTEEELRGLGDNTDVWSPLIVIRALVQMIEKSEIRMTLEDPDVKTEFSTHPLYKVQQLSSPSYWPLDARLLLNYQPLQNPHHFRWLL